MGRLLGRAPIVVVMLMRMNARQIARTHLAARAHDVATRGVELARVPRALALASREGLRARGMRFVVHRDTLPQAQRRNEGHADCGRDRHQQLQHGDLLRALRSPPIQPSWSGAIPARVVSDEPSPRHDDERKQGHPVSDDVCKSADQRCSAGSSNLLGR
jgi:hypothetical protein